MYTKIKRFRETGSYASKVRSTPERSVRTKEKLIKNVREKLRLNPHRRTRKLAKETHVSHSAIQMVLVNDCEVKPYKITQRLVLSDATKKKRFERSKVLLNMLLGGMQLQVLWTDEKLFTIRAICNSQNNRVWINPNILLLLNVKLHSGGKNLHQ